MSRARAPEGGGCCRAERGRRSGGVLSCRASEPEWEGAVVEQGGCCQGAGHLHTAGAGTDPYPLTLPPTNPSAHTHTETAKTAEDTAAAEIEGAAETSETMVATDKTRLLGSGWGVPRDTAAADTGTHPLTLPPIQPTLAPTQRRRRRSGHGSYGDGGDCRDAGDGEDTAVAETEKTAETAETMAATETTPGRLLRARWDVPRAACTRQQQRAQAPNHPPFQRPSPHPHGDAGDGVDTAATETEKSAAEAPETEGTRQRHRSRRRRRQRRRWQRLRRPACSVLCGACRRGARRVHTAAADTGTHPLILPPTEPTPTRRRRRRSGHGSYGDGEDSGDCQDNGLRLRRPACSVVDSVVGPGARRLHTAPVWGAAVEPSEGAGVGLLSSRARAPEWGLLSSRARAPEGGGAVEPSECAKVEEC